MPVPRIILLAVAVFGILGAIIVFLLRKKKKQQHKIKIVKKTSVPPKHQETPPVPPKHQEPPPQHQEPPPIQETLDITEPQPDISQVLEQMKKNEEDLQKKMQSFTESIAKQKKIIKPIKPINYTAIESIDDICKQMKRRLGYDSKTDTQIKEISDRLIKTVNDSEDFQGDKFDLNELPNWNSKIDIPFWRNKFHGTPESTPVEGSTFYFVYEYKSSESSTPDSLSFSFEANWWIENENQTRIIDPKIPIIHKEPSVEPEESMQSMLTEIGQKVSGKYTEPIQDLQQSISTMQTEYKKLQDVLKKPQPTYREAPTTEFGKLTDKIRQTMLNRDTHKVYHNDINRLFDFALEQQKKHDSTEFSFPVTEWYKWGVSDINTLMIQHHGVTGEVVSGDKFLLNLSYAPARSLVQCNIENETGKGYVKITAKGDKKKKSKKKQSGWSKAKVKLKPRDTPTVREESDKIKRWKKRVSREEAQKFEDTLENMKERMFDKISNKELQKKISHIWEVFRNFGIEPSLSPITFSFEYPLTEKYGWTNSDIDVLRKHYHGDKLPADSGKLLFFFSYGPKKSYWEIRNEQKASFVRSDGGPVEKN